MDVILKLQTEQQNKIIASRNAQVFVTADSVILPARRESRKHSGGGDSAGVCLPNKSETCFIRGTDRGGRMQSEADDFSVFASLCSVLLDD